MLKKGLFDGSTENCHLNLQLFSAFTALYHEFQLIVEAVWPTTTVLVRSWCCFRPQQATIFGEAALKIPLTMPAKLQRVHS